MKLESKYIAGDWGTTHLQLFLCEGSQVLDRCDGPGVFAIASAAPTQGFAPTCPAGPNALAFLSGLIIGQDVLGGLAIFEPQLRGSDCVPVIGTGPLVDLYRLALTQHGVNSMPVDASDATLAGLQSLASQADPA